MGSSAKTGKNFFRGSPEHFLDKNAIWDKTPPHLHINCSLHVWGRVQGSQIFKRNSIISIRSKVMAFLVISLSPWSPRRPRRPRVVPVSSPSSPRRPHSPQKVPMWSPWLWSPWLWSPWLWSPWLWSPWSPPHVVPVVPTSSPSSPHRPRHPHVVPIAPRRSLCGLHGCGLRGLLCLRGLHPMLSLWSPRRPRRLHVVPVSSPSSPRHLEGPHIIPNPPDTHFTHPPPPWGGGGSRISKNAIRFELIEIF